MPKAPMTEEEKNKGKVVDPGGFRSPQSFKEGSGQVTEGVTRGAAAFVTGGLSEVPVFDGKSGGQIAGQAARKVDNYVHDRLRGLDPTAAVKVDTSAMDATKAALANLNTSQLRRPVTAQQISAPSVLAASQASSQAPITSDVIRGSTQQIQASQAQTAQMSPAQIAELQRMQAAGISREDVDFRQKQLALANALEAQASGQAPSAAQTQLQRANELAVKQQMALAASARGGNPILAQRQAAQNIAAIQQESAGKSAEMALQEQAAARGQLGEILSQSRGQDIGITTSQASFVQEADKVNKMAEDARVLQQAQLAQDAAKVNAMSATDVAKFNADLATKAAQFNSDQDFRAAMSDAERALDAAKSTALNNINTEQFNAKALDEMERFKADSLLKAKVANQAADLQAKGLSLDAAAKAMGLEVQSLSAILNADSEVMKAKTAAASEQKKGVIGGIMQGAAAVGSMMSDKNQKTNIKKDSKEIQKMLDVLSASTYDYKDTSKEGTAEGKRYGIMAQDLEKSSAGKSVVLDKNGNKMIDVQQSVGVLLASVAHLNKELKKLKGSK
jgi:hypothetical protein